MKKKYAQVTALLLAAVITAASLSACSGGNEQPRAEESATAEAAAEAPNETAEVVAEEPKETAEAIVEEPKETAEAVAEEPKETAEAVAEEPKETTEAVAEEPKEAAKTTAEENTNETVQTSDNEPGSGVISPVKSGVRIEGILVGVDMQPYTGDDGELEKTDTILIYYSDNTFDQFAEIDDQLVPFGAGTYELPEGKSFNDILTGTEPADITVRDTKQYQLGLGLVDAVSSHPYTFNTSGFTPLTPSDDTRANVVTVFAAPDKQPFTDYYGEEEMLDTIWTYYDNGRFDQFAVLDDQLVLFSTGTYSLSAGDDFIYEENVSDNGLIKINREKKYLPGQGLTDYESSHTYKLNTLGFNQLTVIK